MLYIEIPVFLIRLFLEAFSSLDRFIPTTPMLSSTFLNDDSYGHSEYNQPMAIPKGRMIWIRRWFYIDNCLAEPPLPSQKSSMIFNCFNWWCLGINHKKCLQLSKEKVFWIRNTAAVIDTFGKQNQTPEFWKITIIWTILHP